MPERPRAVLRGQASEDQRLGASERFPLRPPFVVLCSRGCTRSSAVCCTRGFRPGLDASGLGGDRRIQELLRPAGGLLQGRRDGHRRPERLRQEQHLRRHQLGARRAERQEPARHVDGGRDLQRQLEPPAAPDGRGEPQGLRPQREQPRRLARVHGDAPPLPQRRERVPDERPDLPPARHPRAVHGHRPRLEGLLDHRAGQDRPDPLLASPPTAARSSRRRRASRSTRPAGARPSSSSRPRSRTSCA